MNELQSLWNSFAGLLVSVLPTSPFQEYISDFVPPSWLGYLNWFLPVGTFLSILSAWLVAIGLYYLYSVIARWIKVIQ